MLQQRWRHSCLAVVVVAALWATSAGTVAGAAAASAAAGGNDAQVAAGTAEAPLAAALGRGGALRARLARHRRRRARGKHHDRSADTAAQQRPAQQQLSERKLDLKPFTREQVADALAHGKRIPRHELRPHGVAESAPKGVAKRSLLQMQVDLDDPDLARPAHKQRRSLNANMDDVSGTSPGHAAAVQFRILLQLKPGAALATVLQQALGLQAEEVAIKVLSKSMRLYAVDANPNLSYTTDELVKLLDASPGVEFAERDKAKKRQSSRRLQAGAAAPPPAALKPVTTTDDPLFPGQWDKRLIGLTARSSKYPGAWSRGVGNQEVVVCVIDTGIDTTHPDLVANLWVNPGEIPGNGIDDDGNGYIDDIHGINPVANNSDIMDTDPSGHGTHCAGNIGAVGNNKVGVSGVNQVVRIMGCKAESPGGDFMSSNLIECIAYALDNGAHITSNSWGGPGGDASDTKAYSVALKAVTEAGQLFVAAAGNDGVDIDQVAEAPAGFQSHYPIIMSVAATDIMDQLASFSNYGVSNVDLAAPGVEVLSTVPGGRYELLSGTSMACPLTSGAAALLLGIYGAAGANITGRGPEIQNLILQTAEPLDSLTDVVRTGARLDVGQAVLAIPTNVSAYFAKDPNAPLPFTVPQRAPPDFDPFTDVFTKETQTEIATPGSEIADVVIPLGEFVLPAVATEFYNDTSTLKDGSSTYSCSCSFCPGPDIVYSFSVTPDEDPTLAWYLLTLDAAPSQDIVISLYQANITDAPGYVAYGGNATFNSTNVTSSDSVLALLGCGGTGEALLQAPIQAGQEYYVIISGIGTYEGAFEVRFSAEPLGTEVPWSAIASPDGYFANGTLVGAPTSLTQSLCSTDASETAELFWSFVAEANATVMLTSGPYNWQLSQGAEPFGGQMCTIYSPQSAMGAVAIGPCSDLQDEIENNLVISNAELCPVYTSTLYSEGLTEFQVTAGERYYVAVSGATYLSIFALAIMVVPEFAADPLLKPVTWAEITAGLSATSSAYGYLDSGDNTNGTQFHDCPCLPGDCNGPEITYSFTAGAYGFVGVVAAPFYGVSDLGLDGQPPCIDAACFYGVYPYVYRMNATTGGYEEVKCGVDYSFVTSSSGTPTLVLGISVETGVTYFVVIDSVQSQALQLYYPSPYYTGTYQTQIIWTGTPDDYMTPICSIPFYQKESRANISNTVAFSSSLSDCAAMPNLNSYQSWHRYTPAAAVSVDISACSTGFTPVAVTVVEEGPLMYGIGQRTLTDQTCSASSTGTNPLCSQAVGVSLQADTSYYFVVDFLSPLLDGHAEGLQLCVQPSGGAALNVSSAEGGCVGWPGATPAPNLFTAADKMQCDSMIQSLQ